MIALKVLFYVTLSLEEQDQVLCFSAFTVPIQITVLKCFMHLVATLYFYRIGE